MGEGVSKAAEKRKRQGQADDLAKRFMSSGVEYTCGAVVMAWVREQPGYEPGHNLERMTWDRVHVLSKEEKR